MLEAGMGCDLYMPFFKFIPEIKFCFGLTNVLQKKRTDLTDPTLEFRYCSRCQGYHCFCAEHINHHTHFTE